MHNNSFFPLMPMTGNILLLIKDNSVFNVVFIVTPEVKKDVVIKDEFSITALAMPNHD